MNTEKSIKSVMEEYEKSLQLSTRIKRLISWARYDLYYGPTPEGDDIDNTGEIYPGFSRAIDEIKDALDDVSDIYIDTMAESWSDKEPEGWQDENGEWVEPEYGDYYRLERSEVLRYILGKELASYL